MTITCLARMSQVVSGTCSSYRKRHGTALTEHTLTYCRCTRIATMNWLLLFCSEHGIYLIERSVSRLSTLICSAKQWRASRRIGSDVGWFACESFASPDQPPPACITNLDMLLLAMFPYSYGIYPTISYVSCDIIITVSHSLTFSHLSI